MHTYIKKNIRRIKQLNRRQKIGILLPVCCVVLFAGTVGFIQLFPNQAGNFADNFLRPVFGTSTVLFVESKFFNTQDVFNQIKYRYITPTAPQFNDTTNISLSGLKGIQTKEHLLSLHTITTLHYFPLLPGEDTWKQLTFNLFPSQLVAASTFVRPDPSRSFAVVDIVKVDMTKVKMGLVAGTKHPGGELGNNGPGMVPENIQQSNTLVAAFSGGFQYSDGHYGMIVGKKIYVPLVKNIATLVIHASGKIEIVNYTGQNLGKDVVGVRQNCPMLISNGTVTAATSAGEATWGWTDIPSNTYVIRTGIGITKNGNLLFAVGPSLIPKTLGEALKAAGAVNAMQLDINPSWTRFIIYTSEGNGKYSYQSYDKALVNGGYDYLHGWYKDFIYLYKAGGSI